jgi:hypothetical protein
MKRLGSAVQCFGSGSQGQVNDQSNVDSNWGLPFAIEAIEHTEKGLQRFHNNKIVPYILPLRSM